MTSSTRSPVAATGAEATGSPLRSVARGGLVSVLGGVGSGVLQLLLVLVVTNLLPVALAGTFFAVTSLFVVVAAGASLGAGVVRLLPQHLHHGRATSSVPSCAPRPGPVPGRRGPRRGRCGARPVPAGGRRPRGRPHRHGGRGLPRAPGRRRARPRLGHDAGAGRHDADRRGRQDRSHRAPGGGCRGRRADGRRSRRRRPRVGRPVPRRRPRGRGPDRAGPSGRGVRARVTTTPRRTARRPARVLVLHVATGVVGLLQIAPRGSTWSWWRPLLGASDAAVYAAASGSCWWGRSASSPCSRRCSPSSPAWWREARRPRRSSFRRSTAWNVACSWPVFMVLGAASPARRRLLGDGYGARPPRCPSCAPPCCSPPGPGPWTSSCSWSGPVPAEPGQRRCCPGRRPRPAAPARPRPRHARRGRGLGRRHRRPQRPPPGPGTTPARSRDRPAVPACWPLPEPPCSSVPRSASSGSPRATRWRRRAWRRCWAVRPTWCWSRGSTPAGARCAWPCSLRGRRAGRHAGGAPRERPARQVSRPSASSSRRRTGRQLLREALRSVREQDYPGTVETFVVFDGGASTAASRSREDSRPVRAVAQRPAAGPLRQPEHRGGEPAHRPRGVPRRRRRLGAGQDAASRSTGWSQSRPRSWPRPRYGSSSATPQHPYGGVPTG